MGESMEQGVTSLLDTDIYKLTMQAAVLQHYPDAQVSYSFTNRSKDAKFSKACVAQFRKFIDRLADVRLLPEERAWLEKSFDFFPKHYLGFLESFRFRPKEQIKLVHQDNGEISLTVHGKWVETILYEVPLLALLSESYFMTDDTKWDMRGQREQTYQKGRKLIEAGCRVAEFGTRRRRSHATQRLVIESLMKAQKDCEGAPGALTGTSNAHLGRLLGLPVYGTVAHEWIMGTAALSGYEGSNAKAMQKWEESYPGYKLSIALTDTFSTGPFWRDFAANPERARNWTGVRQDSGDPFAFAQVAHDAYAALGIDPSKKLIVFSDGLDPERCIEILHHCQKVGIMCSFGVGTNFTNDFRVIESPEPQTDSTLGDGQPRQGTTSKALNIVIKLASINGEPCIKISDELTKNTGLPDVVAAVKHQFGLDTLESQGRSSLVQA